MLNRNLFPARNFHIQNFHFCPKYIFLKRSNWLRLIQWLHIYLQIAIKENSEIKIQSKSFKWITGRTCVAQSVFTNVMDFGSHEDNVRYLPPVRDSKINRSNIMSTLIEKNLLFILIPNIHLTKTSIWPRSTHDWIWGRFIVIIIIRVYYILVSMGTA